MALKKGTSSPKTSYKNGQKLLRFLESRGKDLSPLLIMTHDYPDPDALAGAYALYFLAEKVCGIQSRIVYGGIVGRTENRNMVNILRLPIHKIRPSDLRKYENVALIDTQPQFENNDFPEKRKAAIVIDQHPSLTKPKADLCIVDPECGASCVILAQALLLLKVEIPVRLATALAYGIVTDTLNLYRARRPDIIQAYLDILSFCDMRALARIQIPSHPRKFFVNLGHGIHDAMIRRGLMVSHLKTVDSPDLVAQVADFFLMYKQAKWVLCTGRFRERLHVSLRVVKADTSAARILRDVFPNPEDAGGHGMIAGGSLKMRKGASDQAWAEVEQALVERLLRRLRIPKKGEFYYPFRLLTVTDKTAIKVG